MKNILIESVSNGWIVTERYPCRNTAPEPIAVFNHLEELQKSLPVLLGLREPIPEPKEIISVGLTNAKALF